MIIIFFLYTAIKVPAPCNYAHKLSNLVGDKWSNMNFHAHPNLAK